MSTKPSKKDKGGDNKASQLSELKPQPDFIQSRESLWQVLRSEHEAVITAKQPDAIEVTLPDGKVVPAESWRTSPYDIARGIR